MALRIGINGFGRIGKLLFRYATENPAMQVVHLNDKMPIELLQHLLKYDTLHGQFDADLRREKNILYVNNKAVFVSQQMNPSAIPWDENAVDIVVDSSGQFKTYALLKQHFKKGVKKVILSCPGDESIDKTIVMGVNHQSICNSDTIISNASCTTNCLAILLKVLQEQFGIEKAFMNTVHPFTNNQNLQDGYHSDFRRARAAMNNIIPTSTSAIKTIGKIMPEMNTIFDGFATRVPVADCSFIEIVAQTTKKTNKEEINTAFADYAKNSLKGYLAYCDEPIVSSDINNSKYSAIFDALSTKVIGEDFIQILAWYDNETGYAARLIDLIKYISNHG